MDPIPRRYSLVAQVGDILQEEIRSGLMRDALPSELDLARRFQVSRPTIRDALEILRKAGLIESSRGQNHRIVPQKVSAEVQSETRGVTVLGFAPLDELSPFSLSLMSQIQLAAGSKYEVRIVSNSNITTPAALRDLTSREKQRCWVLIGPPADVLQWFEASRLPCLALAPSIRSSVVPVLAMDMQSVMMHSFSLAKQRGYSGPYLLIPAHRQTSETARFFGEAQQKYPQRDAAIYSHDTTMNGVRRAVEKIMRSKRGDEQPPLILVVRPKHALMTLSVLRAQDLKPGVHYGLISIGRENYIDYVIPTMACYTIKKQRLFKKFLRMLSEILDSGYTRPGLFSVIADFYEGETFPRLGGQ